MFTYILVFAIIAAIIIIYFWDEVEHYIGLIVTACVIAIIGSLFLGSIINLITGAVIYSNDSTSYATCETYDLIETSDDNIDYYLEISGESEDSRYHFAYKDDEITVYQDKKEDIHLNFDKSETPNVEITSREASPFWNLWCLPYSDTQYRITIPSKSNIKFS